MKNMWCLGGLFLLPIVIFSKEKLLDYSLTGLAGKQNIVTVAVVGSGPAGCAASTYAARAGFDVVMFEGPLPGGQLTETGYVENWPGIKRAKGVDIMTNQRAQAISAGTVVKSETVTLVDLSQWPFKVQTEEGTTLHAMSLVIATGSAPRKLGVPGEKQYWGSGESACAVCDAPMYKDLDVIVVGGGDSAAEEVIQLAPYAKTVTLFVRRDAMRASQAMKNKLSEISNVRIEYGKVIKEVLGNGEFVTGVRVLDVKTNKTARRAIDGVFLAIGHGPCTWLFKDRLSLYKDGTIVVNGRSQKTSVPGVVAAGDVADPTYRQAGVAAGDGSKAERDVEHFLQDIGLTPTKIRSWRKMPQRNGLHFYL